MEVIVKKLKTYIEHGLWMMLPCRVYWFLWAFYACFCNCYTMIFKMGMFRAARTGGSVDKDGNPQPWFTYPCIEYLKGRDLSNMDVFEYGSGYSTAFFSRHAKNVVSVENQPKWRPKVLSMCGDRDNVHVIVAQDKDHYLKAINWSKDYDIIVIDGEWRLDCAKLVLGRLRPNGMIIVDNPDDGRWGKAAAEYLSQWNLLRVDFWGFAPYIHWYCATAIFFNLDRRIEYEYI